MNRQQESHLSSLQDSFIQSANTLTSFYKQAAQSVNLSYQQGREDALEEVMLWFMTQGDNGSFRHVSVSQFQTFIRDRLEK